MYFAELMNKTIHPKIENHYNYFKIKSVNDLIEVINSDGFSFNTRITKYILLTNEEDFEFIFNNISRKKSTKILSNAISNNYHKVEEYQNNINKLKNKLKWLSTYKKDKDKVLTHQNLQ